MDQTASQFCKLALVQGNEYGSPVFVSCNQCQPAAGGLP